MKITNVRCEYLKNPLGIDIKNPRISWDFEGFGSQKAFIIHYSINENKFDTDVIKSSSMNYVFNDKFKSRDIVKYVIEVIDENDEHTFSEENSFEFGLLSQDDFVAKWISGNYKVNKKRRYPADYFKKDFDAKDIVKARLYITACGVYEASINGVKVGNVVIAPGSTEYHKRIQYQTYDCLSLLKEGKNSLEVVLGDGYFRGSQGAWGHRNTFGTETKLYLQLELTDKNGKITKVVSDESFKWSNDGPIKINDLKDGERVDANLVPTYKGKAKVTSFKTSFRCSNNFPLIEHEVYKPIRKIITPSGSTVLEFSTMMAGYVAFKVNAKKGDYIRLVMGELINSKGEFEMSNIQCRSNRIVTPLQEIDYVCKDGINEYKPKFYFGGFKYCLVETNIEDIDMNCFSAIAIYNDFNFTSYFDCSNNLINIFHQNTINSLKSNSVEVPSDCPTRERAGWTGDAQIFFNTASYLCNYSAFARKYIEDMKDEQFKNGAYRQICPTVNEDFYMGFLNGSVGWACAGVLIPYRFYKQYGDIRVLKDNYDSMKKYIDFMIKRIGKWGGPMAKHIPMSKENKKFLVNRGQSYGEWLEPAEIYPQNWTDVARPHPEVSTAYTNYTLSVFKEIDEILKKEEDAKRLEKYIDGTRKAYQELVTKKGFTFNTKRQACLVRPLYMHLLSGKQEKEAQQRLIEELNNFDWRIGTGFLSTPFILDVLKEIDVEYAYKLLENEKMPGWLYMAKESTGSIWESWEGTHTKSNIAIASLNHYSKGAMVEFLYRDVLGINVAGENRFLLKPILGGSLSFAKGSYESIYGKISIARERRDGEIKFSFTLPGNTKTLFKYKGFEKEFTSGTYEVILKG